MQGGINCSDRSHAPRRRPVAVPERPPGAALPDQEPGPAVTPQVRMIGRVGHAHDLPVQRVHDLGQAPMPIPAVGGERLERHGLQRRGEWRDGGPAPRLPGQAPDRDARQHPASGVETVGDGLCRVRAHAPGGDPRVERGVGTRNRRAARVHVPSCLRAVHQRGPHAAGLGLRAHEQHGQEPECLAHRGGCEADDACVGRILRDPEPVRVRGQRVGQEPPQRAEVLGHRREAEGCLVALQGGLPGPDARVEIGVPARPAGDGAGGSHRLRRPRRPRTAVARWRPARARPA